MCYCNRWGDIDGDGATNVVDVITLVNFAYKNQDSRKPQPLYCPWEPGDVNCSGSVNVVDVVVAVNFVYKNLPWTLVDCIDLDGNSLTEDDIGCIEP